jgi:hypothetical protein
VTQVADDLRDYDVWHAGYDDPNSTLSWRLQRVQTVIGRVLDTTDGPIRMVSACAGDGRDIVGVLSQRDDAARVRATLLELHPVVAERARAAAVISNLADSVEVRCVDAGSSDAYADIAPADLVLLVGIFGNISDQDMRATVAAGPQLCTAGATLIWSRGRGGGLVDRNEEVRSWFGAAGFTEIGYVTLDRGSRPAIGVVRYDGPPVALVPGRRLFTFER